MGKSEKTRHLYYKIVEAWGLPGCKDIWSRAGNLDEPERQWIFLLMKAYEKNAPLERWPKPRDRLLVETMENDDFVKVIGYIKDFIAQTFNRPEDIENRKWKVNPYEVNEDGNDARFLFTAIVLRSILEHFRLDLASLNRYRPVRFEDEDAEGQYHDLNRVMATNPTTRREREIKRRIIGLFKKTKYGLVHDDTLIKHAEYWYGSRVEYESIEEYAKMLSGQKTQDPERPIDSSRISNDIAIYDEATGYPRCSRD
ncbi:hypothetical protein ACFLX5_04210 [Chloroflexota bacterium]